MWEFAMYIRVVILDNLREKKKLMWVVFACVCLPEAEAERNTKNIKMAKQCHQPLGTIDLTFPTVTSRSSNRSGSNVTKNRYACRMLAMIQGCHHMCILVESPGKMEIPYISLSSINQPFHSAWRIEIHGCNWMQSRISTSRNTINLASFS